MNKNIYFLHYDNMKSKYIINNNELIINFNFFYNISSTISLNNIQFYINELITNNNINFKGNKIKIYINGLLTGTFYLTNNYYKKNTKIFLNNKNCYFWNNNYTEINTNNKVINKNIITI